jgi:hypothetical protein
MIEVRASLDVAEKRNIRMLPSCGIQLRIVHMRTDISYERITSIFRVENQPSKKSAFSMWLGIAVQYQIPTKESISKKLTLVTRLEGTPVVWLANPVSYIRGRT